MATTSNTITATAGQTEFSFSFPYLKKESIKVTIDTVATTAFTIPDNNPTTVVLNSGATAGQVIVISRLTSTTATPATFFSGGAIRSQDLNDNFDSILYITQEKENELTEVIAGGIADGSITSSKLADQSVGTAALIDGGVATVDLADNAVTPAKLDRTYVDTTGDTMTGGLIVPSLSSPSGNLPIQRASIADSQVQSFYFSDNTANLYRFEPIPSWCKHVRYTVYTNLSQNSTSNGGFYLRYATSTGEYLDPTNSIGQLWSAGPSSGGVTQNANDPLVLKANPTYSYTYGFVHDLYFADYHNTKISWARGLGSLRFNQESWLISYSQNPIVLPANVDRVGAILFGGSVTGSPGQFNEAWVSQTFMTDGPVQEADMGITPTPIP